MTEIILRRETGVTHSALNDLRDTWPRERGLERARGEAPEIEADHDLAAVSVYLQHVHDNYATRTFEAYQREIVRFCYWCSRYRRRALSDLKHEDFAAYRQFLIDPPAEEIGPHGARLVRRKLFSAAGRSPNTVAYAMTVLSGLLQFLVDRLYLRRNLIASVRKWKQLQPAAQHDKRIPKQGLRAVGAWLAGMPEDAPAELEAKVRLRALMATAFGLALRRAELAAMRWEDVRWDPLSGQHVWRGTRKGGDAKESVIPHSALDALADYREVLGMAREPAPAGSGPVFRKVLSRRPKGEGAGGEGLTPRRVGDLMKEAFSNTADRLEQLATDADGRATADLLRRATAHWMRHTRASELVEGGMTMAEVAGVLFHRDPKTTQAIYAHADRRRMAKSGAFQDGPF